MKIKGSYFTNEDWYFSDSCKKLDVFVDMLCCNILANDWEEVE